jgi:hypothetical protein
MGNLHEKRYTFLIISRPILLSMRNISDASCREKSKQTFFSFKSCRLWDNCKYTVQPGRQHMIIWRMRIGRWIPKATNPHLENVIFIAFLLQQWLHERASVLRYTYIVCLASYLSFWYPNFTFKF